MFSNTITSLHVTTKEWLGASVSHNFLSSYALLVTLSSGLDMLSYAVVSLSHGIGLEYIRQLVGHDVVTMFDPQLILILAYFLGQSI